VKRPRNRRHRRNCNEPGHAHKLTFSCYHRYQFLNSERTCQWLADAIEQARTELRFDLWAFVFMPEHAHLLIYPREKVYDIADIRKAIKSPVARLGIAFLEEHAPEWLPRITRRRGDKVERLFWQSGGGYDRNITEPNTLWKAIEYIHLNPVRRGLVERAEDWRWSSAAWFLGTGTPPLIPDRIPPEWVS
jgi:putative transposase